MKNNLLEIRHWILMVFVLCFIAESSWAQSVKEEEGPRFNLLKICSGGDIGPDHNAPSTGTTHCMESLPVLYDRDNSRYVDVVVYMTYAITTPPYPHTGDYVDFPSEFPAMNLRYEYEPDTWQITPAATQLYYHGIVSVGNQGDHPVYSTTFKMPISDYYLDACDLHTEFIFGIDVELKTRAILPNSGMHGYEFYPIHSYSSSTGLFSCNVFDETFCDCNPNDQSCEGESPLDPIGTVSICLQCSSDFDGGSTPRNLTGSAVAFEEFQVTPNPFSENVNMAISLAQATTVEYKVYDAQGKLILQFKEDVAKGDHQKPFDTAAFDAGLYYFQVTYGGTQVVKKMMKLQP